MTISELIKQIVDNTGFYVINNYTAAFSLSFITVTAKIQSLHLIVFGKC